ncbi:capsular polysaccharide synthesis protein [Collinsella sp. An2]|uniref:capsular polysaccharide synthesis protein n=1 Tax=Collinsella sp. An2 TaxID=1965585 RepID=UPI000B37D94D|nr:capsular polysaccharide synthesis protein [Collinsella sp. An2]OUP08472.1 capsular biosynthesis protein [Collinsella sp. An2]
MSDMKRLIAKSVRSHTLFSDAASYGLIKLGFADKYLAGLVSMYRSYHWLCKRFSSECDELVASSQKAKQAVKNAGSINNQAWVCWLQGMEKAPEIVQICYESICYWLEGWDIVVITSDNYSDYADLPEHVVEKWKQGVITNTHFSDILRLDLLVRHGGLWLDATTLLTGPLPGYITNNELFVYRNGWMDTDMIQMASWLIYTSSPKNIVLQTTRDLLFEYWCHYSYLKNYFLMHMFFRMVSDRCPDEWSKVSYINQVDNHLLMSELEKPYDAVRIDEIKRLTTVHKLTYKLSEKLETGCTAYQLAAIFR